MSPRDRIILGIVGLVAVIAAAWLLVIQPKRSELARLNRQVSSEQAQLTSAQSELAAGQAARSQFGASYASMVRLGEAVPTDDNVGSLIYQLQSAANGARVDFRSLSLGSSSGSAPSAPSQSSSGSSSGGSSSGGGQGALPPGVTVGSAGFPVEPFSFTFRGNFFSLADFFARLQRFVTPTERGVLVRGRLLTLSSITLGPGASGFPQIDATVSANAYLLPAAQGLTAGATPVGPGVSGSGAPSTSPPVGQPAPGPTPAPAPRAGGSSGGSVPPTAAVTGGQP